MRVRLGLESGWLWRQEVAGVRPWGDPQTPWNNMPGGEPTQKGARLRYRVNHSHQPPPTFNC